MMSHFGLILLVLLQSSGLVDSQSFTEDPRDISTLIGRTETFECSYDGSAVPHWNVFVPDSSGTLPPTATFSLVRGRMEPLIGGGYLNYTSSADGVAMLDVLVTRESNGTEFQCILILETDVESKQASLTVFGEPLVPAVTVDEVEYNFINVSWTEPWSSDLAPVEEYTVQLLRGGSVEVNETITGNSPLTYLFEGLTHSTQYVVHVTAANSVGQGQFGMVQQTTPLPDAPPPPTGLSRTVMIVAKVPNITISWEMPVLGVTQSEITGYTFNYILINNSNASYMTEPVPTVQTSHRFNAAQLGNSYNVFLTATNDGGVSNASESLNLSATYLQNVTFERMASGVIVSCEFAASDQDLLCRVTFSIGTEVTRTVTANVMGDSSPPVASVVVSDLPQEVLEYSVEAVNVSDGMAIEEFRITGMISLIPEGGDSGRLLTDEQIFIIVGVVVGTVVLIVTLLSIIFVILAIRDRKNNGSRRKPWKDPKVDQNNKRTPAELHLRPNSDPGSLQKSELYTGERETYNC